MNKTVHNIEFKDLVGRWLGVNGCEVSFLNISEIFEDKGKKFNFRFGYRDDKKKLEFAALVHF